MHYREMLNEVEKLEFIPNEARAETALKVVLGVLVRRLEEDVARELTASLPHPLDYATLRGEQVNATDLSVPQYRDAIANRFNLKDEQAWQLVRTVLHLVRDGMAEEVVDDIQDGLPADWQQVFTSG